MAIDPNIPLSALQFRIPSPEQQLGQQQQLQNLAQQKIGMNIELAEDRAKLSKSIKEQALAAYDAVKDAPADVRLRRFREAYLQGIEDSVVSGQAKAYGISDEDVAKARSSIPADPELIRPSLGYPKRGTRGPIPRGYEIDPTNPNQYRRVPLADAPTKVSQDLGPEWSPDPGAPGHFIHTGGIPIAEITRTAADYSGAPKGAPQGFKVPSGYIPDPERPGSIMPMPGGPRDPRVNKAYTKIGQVYDDIKNGHIPADVGQQVIAAQFPGHKQEGVPLTPGGLKLAAEMVRAGRTLPGGWTAKGMSRGNQILNEMAAHEEGGAGSGAVVREQMEFKNQQNVLKDFTTGKTANNITAINTAIGHIGTMHELGEALKNGNVKLMNQLFNRIATETGQPGVNNFDVAKAAVANELMRVFRQVGASETEVKAWEEKFSSAASPAQINGALQTAGKLLNSRISAVQDQWKRGMKTDKPFPNLLSPHSKDVLTNTLKTGTEEKVAPEHTFTKEEIEAEMKRRGLK